ncbi:MAG: type IV toxin-antitoxin system AbiEi family antitoxin domain-containing protein [Myxococcales bacterium]|nr:type IV toxin-antitoxin system AbiEi family antitoxin domain-containing protein [Myxococcales bacterium]
MIHDKLPPVLIKKGIFTYTQAVKCGLSQYHIEQLVKQGLLEHIDRGLYQIPTDSFDNEDIYRQTTVIAGFPCAICLWSALVFYDLTDEIDKETWVWVPLSKRVKNKSIHAVRRANPKWRTGIDKHEGYWVTSIERTIVEAIAYPRYIGTLAAHSAVKRAINKKHTDISKIIAMAKQLNLFRRIKTVLETYIDY